MARKREARQATWAGATGAYGWVRATSRSPPTARHHPRDPEGSGQTWGPGEAWGGGLGSECRLTQSSGRRELRSGPGSEVISSA